MEELKEKISDLLEERKRLERSVINNFFNILFWKNYNEGYIDVKDRHSILDEIEKATNGDFLNAKKILPFVNKIRKQIGLKELTAELDGCLMEITDEVRKRLILQGLK